MTNTTLQIILTIIGIIGSLGLFAGGLGFLWGRIKSGTKEGKLESADLLSSNDQIKQFYKEQNDDLKEINKVLGEKVETLTREVGEIRGQLNAETQQRKEYQAIFENRDPDTKKFMEIMVQSVKDQSTVNSEMIRVLGEIHSMSLEEHNRDFKINATVSTK